MSKRYSWGEFAWGPRGPSIALHGWADDHNTLILGLVAFTLYLRVPQWVFKEYDIERSYGFSFTEDGLHVSWGGRTKVLWYPWSWEFYKRWELVAGGSYAQGGQFWVELPRQMNHGQLGTKETTDYVYVLKRGEVQSRTATFYVEKMEWRWRWLMWLPFPRKCRQSISVDFSAEVGERTGSWKGGVLGCGYEMRPGETALDTLRRMESERKFA